MTVYLEGMDVSMESDCMNEEGSTSGPFGLESSSTTEIQCMFSPPASSLTSGLSVDEEGEETYTAHANQQNQEETQNNNILFPDEDSDTTLTDPSHPFAVQTKRGDTFLCQWKDSNPRKLVLETLLYDIPEEREEEDLNNEADVGSKGHDEEFCEQPDCVVHHLDAFLASIMFKSNMNDGRKGLKRGVFEDETETGNNKKFKEVPDEIEIQADNIIIELPSEEFPTEDEEKEDQMKELHDLLENIQDMTDFSVLHGSEHEYLEMEEDD